MGSKDRRKGLVSLPLFELWMGLKGRLSISEGQAWWEKSRESRSCEMCKDPRSCKGRGQQQQPAKRQHADHTTLHAFTLSLVVGQVNVNERWPRWDSNVH